MMIYRSEMEISVMTAWIISVDLKHRQSGLIGHGEDLNNSRKAYAIALKDLEKQLEARNQDDARLLREGHGLNKPCTSPWTGSD